MIDNQIMSTMGNQSQEGLESMPAKKQKIKEIKESILLHLLEKPIEHFVTIVRFCCCLFIGLILASHASAENLNQLSNGIVASNDILLDKGLRGVFPPLEGQREQIYGKWQQTIATSLQNSTSQYNNYCLNFKINGDVELTHRRCKGDLKLQWQIFYYNIHLQFHQSQQNPNQPDMQIPNQKQDIECIVQDRKFINLLTNSSIWSIHANNLYIISELEKNEKIESSMLIFEKIGS